MNFLRRSFYRLREPEVVHKEKSLNWTRAVVAGCFSAAAMMAFVDSFAMLELIPFSFAHYLGSLILNSFGYPPSGTHAWTLGFFASLGVGALSALVYAYLFENRYRRASVALGVRIGFYHALVAGFLIFPYFGMIHEYTTGLYQNFGFMGSGTNLATPLVVTVGHLVFGATMGVLYGAVGVERMRSTISEPEYKDPLAPPVNRDEPGEFGKVA